MHFCTLNKYAMKITNDILKDYFYDKCSQGRNRNPKVVDRK